MFYIRLLQSSFEGQSNVIFPVFSIEGIIIKFVWIKLVYESTECQAISKATAEILYVDTL